MWIGRSLLGLEHLHVTDVVYVQLRLQHYYETLSVQAHRQNGSTKRHFAYCRVSLGILYSEHARRQRQRDQRGGKKHLQAGDIALVRLRLLIEGIRRVYAIAIRGTDAQMAVILVECHEIHICHVRQVFNE